MHSMETNAMCMNKSCWHFVTHHRFSKTRVTCHESRKTYPSTRDPASRQQIEEEEYLAAVII